MYSKTIQKWMAYSGPISVTVFFIGIIIAGFMPPPSPSLSQQEVVDFFRENRTRILIGMNIMMVCGIFVFPFIALVSQYMLRMKGTSPALAYGQLAAGTMGVAFFSVPGILFIITAYRPDRMAELIYLMYDFSWIVTVLPWPFQFAVNIFIALAVLGDKSENPVFPRWMGFFSCWMAVLLMPASVLCFVHDGPFAWNGIFPFWIPGTVFGIYFCTLAYVLIRAVNNDEQAI
jgi:hypothetical protein